MDVLTRMFLGHRYIYQEGKTEVEASGVGSVGIPYQKGKGYFILPHSYFGNKKRECCRHRITMGNLHKFSSLAIQGRTIDSRVEGLYYPW